MQMPQRLDAKHSDELFSFLSSSRKRKTAPLSRRADRAEIGLGSVLGGAQPTNFGAPLTHAREVVTGDPSLQTQECEGPPSAGQKIRPSHAETARHFEFGISNFVPIAPLKLFR
jgi:hypothetical protein